MAYDETPKKPIEIRDGRTKGHADHDDLISRASEAGSYCDRTDAAAQGVGYLGVDDLDRLRRKNINK
jgi:hypothetical protein